MSKRISQVQTTRDIVERLKLQYPLPSTGGNWTQLREDEQFFETLLEAIAAGHSVSSFCDSVGLPGAKVTAWLSRLSGERQELYEAARAERAAYMAEQILKVTQQVEDGILLVPQARLITDNLKWMAERMDPTLWGNRIQVKADIKSTTEMHLEAVKALALMVRNKQDGTVIEGEVEPTLQPRSDLEVMGPDPKRRELIEDRKRKAEIEELLS